MSDETNPFLGKASPQTFESLNPYAPTLNVSLNVVPTSEAEAFRRLHLSHEASVKSVGLLYLLGSIFLITLGVMTLLASFASGPSQEEASVWIVVAVGVFYLAFGLTQFLTGLAIRRLRPWSRIAGIFFSVFGLIGFPIGTLISIYFLYLLMSRKGVTVFSAAYQDVIAQTPDIKYKTSKVVWVLLGILLLVFAVGLLGLIVS